MIYSIIILGFWIALFCVIATCIIVTNERMHDVCITRAKQSDSIVTVTISSASSSTPAETDDPPSYSSVTNPLQHPRQLHA